MKEIKCYVEGGYTRGVPDYGGIYRIDDNKLVYLCDYGATLTENARRCAEANGWVFKKMYKDRKYEGMVLVFEDKSEKK